MQAPLFHHTTLEMQILEILKYGPSTRLQIVEYFINRGFTKQGVYKALRNLHASDCIAVQKGAVSLSSIWLSRMSTYVRDAQFSLMNNPDNTTLANSFLFLKEGESLTYYFQNLLSTMQFWNHFFSLLYKNLPPNTPLFTYNTHHWFTFLPDRAEHVVRNDLKTIDRNYYIVVGARSPLEKISRKQYQNPPLIQMHNVKEPLFKPGYYFDLFGDTIAELFVPPVLENQITDFMMQQNPPKKTEDIITTLKPILESPGKVRAKISRNAKKSNRLRTKLKKYFL